MTTEFGNYLKYANLQMAAEVFFGLQPDLDPDPGQTYSGLIAVSHLTVGNKHSSKFTNTLAGDFVQQWEVVQHISNTETGFSGTLFRARKDDPDAGIMVGELVLSFRSTEFVEDQVRDSGVTNKGIKEFGWAFGQIADLWAWWNEDLKALVGDAQIAVTGYSLGGHLAYAFSRLLAESGDPARISAMYTFNGAGVGEVTDGTLTAAIDAFEDYCKGDLAEDCGFTDPAVRALYQSLRSKAPGTLSAQDAAAAISIAQYPYSASGEATLLAEAIGRVITIQNEIDRIDGISGAAHLPDTEVAGESLAA